MGATIVQITGDRFTMNGKPTYEGREWNGIQIEGLLMNTRMVQGLFDDKNPETVSRWKYPDTGEWDPERNVREFLEHSRLICKSAYHKGIFLSRIFRFTACRQEQP